MESSKKKARRRVVNRIWRYSAVVLLVLSIGISYVFISETKQIDAKTTPKIVNNNIEIGTDKATLTLENGELIVLEKWDFV